MRYLSRNKIYEKVDPFKNAKKLYIFCEGDREIEYFKFFQGFASNIDIIPVPNDNGKSDPVKLKENAELHFNGNKNTPAVFSFSTELEDEVWFVIDTDRWNEGDKINKLKTFVDEKNVQYPGWFVVQSNPCFELWLYYHFHADKPNEEDVMCFASFKEYVASKITGGFDNRGMPVEIQKATKNAEINFELADDQPALFSTDVFKVANQIIKFTKAQLNQCLEDLRKSQPNRSE